MEGILFVPSLLSPLVCPERQALRAQLVDNIDERQKYRRAPPHRQSDPMCTCRLRRALTNLAESLPYERQSPTVALPRQMDDSQGQKN